jgi:two-component system response regulator AtoC
VIPIRIPPLRERHEEIPVLAGHFLHRFNDAYGRSAVISAETMRAFTEYPWPGNVRELENAVKRIVVLAAAMLRQDLPPAEPVAPAGLKTIARRAARAAERIAIETVLDHVDGNRVKAARLLRISYSALRYTIIECGLARPTRGSVIEA